MAIFGDSFYYCSRFLSIFLRILDRIFLFQNNFRKMAKSQFAYIYFKIIGSPSCEISPKKIPWSLRVCTHSDNNGGRPSSSHCLLDRSVGRCNCFLMLWMLVMCYVSFPNFFLLLLQTKHLDLSMCQFGVVWLVQSPPRPLLLLPPRPFSWWKNLT